MLAQVLVRKIPSTPGVVYVHAGSGGIEKYIKNCRGQEASSWCDAMKEEEDKFRECATWEVSKGKRRKRFAGEVVVGPRRDLPDGRQAVWLYLAGLPGQAWEGFLALVRLDGARLVVDAVALWDNGSDAAPQLRPMTLGGRFGWLEPTASSGRPKTAGERLWLVKGGELVNAGEWERTWRPTTTSRSGPRRRWRWSDAPRATVYSFPVDTESP